MNKNKMKRFKDYMTFGSSRQGNIAIVTILLVIAVVIILNLIVGQLPESVRSFDFSNQKIYEISDTSKEFISKLDKDIDIYLLSAGTTDNRITKFVSEYSELSEHINVQEINIMESPSYLTTYDCDADSLVVSCESTGKYTTVSYSGTSDALILTSYDYYTGQSSESAFDADGQITSAIDYVTGDVSETIYTLTGHSESELPSSISDLINKANVGISDTSVDLLMDGSIPDDCSVLVCYNPTSDLADEEVNILSDYMQSGGNLLLVLNDSSLSNFNSLLSEYGLTMLDGYVGDQTQYYQNFAEQYGYFCFAPTYSTESELTSAIDENSIMIYARGMTESKPVRDSITVDPFMTTSEQGINYVDENNYSTGQYITGATAIETIDDNTVSRLTVFTSAAFLDDGITSQFSGMANLDIFMNAFTANFDDVSNFTIEAKSLQITYNTISNYLFLSLMIIVIIPLFILIGGFIYWYKRRKL
jgi:ABC-2 type transport system permease protein